MPRKPNLDIIDGLREASLDALKSGHTVESAIILFQTIESLLRIGIRALIGTV